MRICCERSRKLLFIMFIVVTDDNRDLCWNMLYVYCSVIKDNRRRMRKGTEYASGV